MASNCGQQWGMYYSTAKKKIRFLFRRSRGWRIHRVICDQRETYFSSFLLFLFDQAACCKMWNFQYYSEKLDHPAMKGKRVKSGTLSSVSLETSAALYTPAEKFRAALWHGGTSREQRNGVSLLANFEIRYTVLSASPQLAWYLRT